MKKLITLVFAAILIMSNQSFSQSGLFITDYDYSEYPKVTFDYYIFNNTANQNNSITSNDIIILNNESNITDKEISCSSFEENLSNSVVLSMDLSFDNETKFVFDSVRNTIEQMINLSFYDEIALTSFSTVNHLNFDFNQSHSTIINELNKLKPSSNSYLDSAFYSSPIGIDKVLENSNDENNKHYVLFTKHNTPIPNQILQKLRDSNISFYLVLLGSEANNVTKTFFDQNSGFYLFDNIDEKQNLKLAMLSITELIKGNAPCSMEFNSEFNCDTVLSTTISVPTVASQIEYNYKISSSIIPRLELLPSFYGFSSVEPGDTKEADIVITAVNSDILIDNIEFEDDKNGVFNIISGQINSPQILAEGDNWPIRIEYAPSDSNIVFTRLLINSNACKNKEVLITGGYPNTPPVVKNIKIENPNKCDEVLIVGEKYKVEWSGLLPSDVIQLEYSTNNGQSWDTLATNVTDLEHEWIVPDLESDECLVRGVQLWPNNIGRTLDLEHPQPVNTAFFDHVDGSKAVTSCYDGVVRLWNTNTGRLIRDFDQHTMQVNYAVLSPADDMIVSASDDSNVILWDANDNTTPIYVFDTHQSEVRSANFNPTGDRVVSVDKSGVCKIFNTTNGIEEHSFNPDGNKPLWFAEYHPSGNYYLTGGNGGAVKVWDSETNEYVKEFDIAGWVNQFALNADGTRILVVDILSKEATVWDFDSGDMLFTLKHSSQSNLPLNSGTFNSFSGEEYMLTSGDDNSAIMWNSQGDSINVFKEHTNSVRTAMFNFDGQRVITSSWDNTAKIWNLDERDLQMDTSECQFTIAKMRYDSKDLVFDKTYIGSYRDTTLADAIINLNNFQMEIENAFIRGEHKSDFILQSVLNENVIDTVANFDSQDIDIRFIPSDLGIKNAELVIVVRGMDIVIPLEGEGIEKSLEVIASDIVFENVDIGDFRDKTVDLAIRNNESEALDIDSIYIDIPRSNDYSLIFEDELTSIEPGQEIGLIVRFAPQYIDRSNADIVFIHNGNNSPTRISLLGTGSFPVFDTTTVSLDNIEAKSGEKVISKVYITTLKEELNNGDLEGIQFDLSFNSSLLFPLFDYDDESVANGIKTVTVSIQSDENWFDITTKESKVQAEKIEVAELEFNTTLGNDSTTSLNINNSTVIGKSKLKINEEDSEMRLLDLCYEGGARLFDSQSKLDLQVPSPSPLNRSTSFEYELLENSNVSIDIIDYTGGVVLNLVNEYKTIGKHKGKLNISSLSNGLYFIRLITDNQILMKKIQIRK
jgi:WD40 repeat protein